MSFPHRFVAGAGARWLAAACVAVLGAAPAWAQGTIKIGEINSYKAQPVFLEAYKKGMNLAVDEVNAAGGVGGKKLVLVTRDDNANPGEAVRLADELVSRERVDLLVGTFLSHIGLALADYAQQKKKFFLASEALTDKITWQNGNAYAYRLRSSTYMLSAALVPDALKLKKKRWAIVYPNYEYGQSAVDTFKKRMKEQQPDIEFVIEQAAPLGKLDAGSVAQAIADAKPDAIFNVLFGPDLAKFVREGTTRGLFKNTPVVSVLTGEPEYLEPLRDEAPVGWIVTGYPWYSIDTPAHKAFVAAYQAKYGKEDLRLGSVIGYSTIKSLAEGVKRAGGKTDAESMVKAFSGLKVPTPDGAIEYRALDHQSTLGVYVGKIALKDGKGVMVDYRYVPGETLLPPDAEVRKLRPVP
ncbi:ABC transporter substrate-binding protein [Paracidovorax valerianellae]|uniref:Amino acid/amide ABC transporter substrate-binding protein, HAAT family n=1 Tax=Paracidovorax valerianellae TaxID=187868 RepID=A0A1G6SGS8_9BURK|nr:ABC transporter substrate-binding protein [Paracidovorax valerianellae]MDA8444283.1 ABC transporter substrate-binding protein [Paracidovorax valerianellae]SDD15854.1 amino acid/amide ABC transporter substrate-binding protein, HAAT family [Paracidovorax valerianellae]